MHEKSDMTIIQVRDVPDDVAEVIAERARAKHQSVSAYLRDLMASDAERELRRRAMATWMDEVAELQATMDLSRVPNDPGNLVRQIRDEYEVGEG